MLDKRAPQWMGVCLDSSGVPVSEHLILGPSSLPFKWIKWSTSSGLLGDSHETQRDSLTLSVYVSFILA